MQSLKRQSGMSIPAMLLIAIMAGFYVVSAIKLIPHYFEYLSVKDIITQVSNEYKPGVTSIGEIRRSIDKRFNTNQIYGLNVHKIPIYRKGGKTFIDANYEARVTLAGRLDAVLRFDDLLFVAGQPNIK